MKIQKLSNSYLKTQNDVQNHIGFKALSPALKTKLIEVSTGSAKDAFVKLSALAGLGGVVTFLQSCLDKEPTQEEKTNLENLANLAAEKANSYLTNSETIDLYLETSSAVDTAEANVWAKGLASEPVPAEVAIATIIAF